MAAGGQMAEFFATLGFQINKGDIQKVDKQLDILEARAKRLTESSLSNIKVNISRFGFSDNFNTRLHKALQARMKLATSKGVSAEVKISKFDVDRNELLREMRDAVRYVEQNLRVNIRSNINRPTVGGGVGGGQAEGGVNRFGAGLGAGAAAGNLGRGFIPGLGLAFGVSQLNNINQELMGQKYAAQAVFGSREKGNEGLEWLRSLSNEVGMDYRSQGQPYIRMIASATNAGMGVTETQNMYAGISRYGRTMGLGKEDMKGSMRAIEQMLNKQQVYAEELKTQLAEKMPGVMSAMAEAVTGDRNNTKELFKMMEQGEVSSIEYLGEFARILEKRAMAGGAYEEAIRASAAEQGRFNNVFNDMVKVFSEAGFEEGQAEIFRTMSRFFKEMTPLVEGFGDAWKYIAAIIRVPLGLLVDLSTGIEKLSSVTGYAKGDIIALGTAFSLLAFPLTRAFTLIAGAFILLEDFTAFLTGRGSAIGDFLKELEETDPEFFKELESLFDNIKGLVETIYTGWEELLNLLSSSVNMPVVEQLKEVVTELNKAIEGVLILSGKKDGESESLFKVRKGSVMDWVMPDSYPRYGREDIDRSSAGGMLEFYQSIVEGQLGSSMLQGAETAATVSSLGMVNFGDPSKNPYMNDYISFNRESASPQGNNSGSSGLSQFFDLKIDIQGYNIESDQQLALEIKKQFDEYIKPTSDKAVNSSQ